MKMEKLELKSGLKKISKKSQGNLLKSTELLQTKKSCKMLKRLSFIVLLMFVMNPCIYAQKADKPPTEEFINTVLFPADFQKGIYHINKNFPGVMILKFTDVSGVEKLKNLRLIIDMPEGYSCIGVCPNFSNTNGGGWQMEKMETQNIERNDGKYTSYSVLLSESVTDKLKPKSPWFGWNLGERICIKSTPEAGVNDKKNAYIKFTADNWAGQEKKIELVQLPELSLNGPSANKFEMMISRFISFTIPDDAIRETYINYWKSLSKKTTCLVNDWKDWNAIDTDLRKKVISNFNTMFMLDEHVGTPFVGDSKKWVNDRIKNSYGKIKPGPIVFATDNAGKHSKVGDRYVMLCPGYVGKDNFFWNDHVALFLKEALSDITVSGIVYDIEPTAMDFCFCENCMHEFKDFAKLEKIPSVEEIQKNHSDKWFDFRVQQNAAIIKAFCDCVKKNFPGVQAIVCTDNLHANSAPVAKWCGVDVRLSDKDADLFMNMPYYTGIRYYDDIELNNKALKTPNFPLNDPAEMDIAFFSKYTPEKIKQNIIATASLGCKGFGFWPNDVLDGKYLQEIKNAYMLVAKAEEYYFAKRNDAAVSVKPEIFFEKTIADDGRNITLKFPDCSDALRWTVHEKDGNYLVTIINYVPNELILNLNAFSLGNNSYTARDIETDGLFYKDKNTLLGTDDIRKGFMVNVPGNSLKVIEITKDDIKVAADKTMAVYQDDMKLKLDNIKKNFPDDYNFKEAKNATSEIAWGVLIDQKVPLVKMVSGDFKIYVNASKGAEIISWNDKKNLKDNLLFKDRGFLGDLVLSDDAKGKGGYRFILEKAFIDNGNPVAIFKYTVPREGANPQEEPLENLEVEKQITMQNQGKTINIKYVFTNKSKSKKDMLLGFRIKNFTRTAMRPENNESLSKMSKISFWTSEGVKSIEEGNFETNNTILQADAKMPGFINIKPQAIKWINSPIKVDVRSGDRKEHLEIIPDKNNTVGFYVWWAKVYTIELISTEKLIKAGESFTYEYSVTR